MNKFTFSIIICLLLGISVSAQQIGTTPGFYVSNPYLSNPADGGQTDKLKAEVSFREQWVGIAGAPRNISAGVYGFGNKTSKLGFLFQSNSHGIFQSVISSLSYSHEVELAKGHDLILAVRAGVLQNNIQDQYKETNEGYDPAYYSEFVNKLRFQSGFGLNYSFKDLSVDLVVPLLYSGVEGNFFENAIAAASYDFYMLSSDLKLTPALAFKYYNDNPSQTEFAITGTWHEKISLTAGGRSNNDFMLALGFLTGSFGVSYIYEINTSVLSSVSSGTHGIMLSLEFGNPKRDDSPLYNEDFRY